MPQQPPSVYRRHARPAHRAHQQILIVAGHPLLQQKSGFADADYPETPFISPARPAPPVLETHTAAGVLFSNYSPLFSGSLIPSPLGALAPAAIIFFPPKALKNPDSSTKAAAAVGTATLANWIKDCRIYFREREIDDDDRKLEEVGDRFQDSSPADMWFKDARVQTKVSGAWKVFETAFLARFEGGVLRQADGHGPWEKELQVLQDDDVRALNERALTAEEAAQRQTVHDLEDTVVEEEGGIAALGVVALGESRRTLSWIWYTTTLDDPSEVELVEALQVEWCKSYARMHRWHEDVVLTEEEIPRTIEYGYWSAFEWIRRAPLRANDVSDELLEGLAAYSREQECREMQTCDMLSDKWAHIRLLGRAYLARETAAGAALVVPLEDGNADEGDEEEGQPDYEDDGDDEVLE
ncbi:hypothetical protein B0H13DRAFT_2505539 [Mycena leptocephala]|nr:hypothetical protein B0H13DRAFT_2505539 [Mycena leptocephala]